MADGRTLAVGGDGDNVGNGYINDGRQAIQTFSLDSKQWNVIGTTQTPRWYPTTIILPDERYPHTSNLSYLIVGGLKESYLPSDPTRDNPTIETFPASGPPKPLDILSASYPFNSYPMVHMLPNNKIFILSGFKAVLLDFPSLEISSRLPDLNHPDLKPRSFPYTATSVILPLWPSQNYRSQILICGGTRQNMEAATTCDKMIATENGGYWQPEQDTPIPRVMGDFVILPSTPPITPKTNS
jgi:hypothetical protein